MEAIPIHRKRPARDMTHIWIDREYLPHDIRTITTMHLKSILLHVWNKGVPHEHKLGNRRPACVRTENAPRLLERLLEEAWKRTDGDQEFNMWRAHLTRHKRLHSDEAYNR